MNQDEYNCDVCGEYTPNGSGYYPPDSEEYRVCQDCNYKILAKQVVKQTER